MNRSILAGCKFSVALTRAYLLEEVSKLDAVHSASISTYVDDTPFLSIGSYSKVYNSIADLAVAFCKAVQRLKLQLSPKALLVANTPKLALARQKELKEYGLKFGIASVAPDLGIPFTAGLLLPKGHGVAARVGKTQLRFSRLKWLANSSRRARILFSMSVFPASFYGHVAHPLTSSQLKLIDNMAVACTGINQASRCKTTALIVSYGQNTHPAARIVSDLFKAWLRLLAGFETKFGSLGLIKQAWRALFFLIHSRVQQKSLFPAWQQEVP